MSSEKENSSSPAAWKIELPGIHDAADRASIKGQKQYLVLSSVRLGSLFLAAFFGALIFALSHSSWLGWVVLCAFAFAAISELLLIVIQPERDWYAGRAIAESSKTLAWRFAVGGQPFGLVLPPEEVDALIVKRISEVVAKGKDRLDLGAGPAAVTDSMKMLRSSDFEIRRSSYLEFRTRAQRTWYSDKAKANASWATVWRYFLLIGEFVAVIAAALALQADRLFDFAGVIAVIVASGAAWLAIKQHSQLTSAYRVAAIELALQENTLASVPEEKWPQAVADAEEAISREHTMWLASRGRERVPGVEHQELPHR